MCLVDAIIFCNFKTYITVSSFVGAFLQLLGPFCSWGLSAVVGAFLQLLGPFCSWGLSAGYQPRPQVVDRGTTARYGGQLRYI